MGAITDRASRTCRRGPVSAAWSTTRPLAKGLVIIETVAVLSIDDETFAPLPDLAGPSGLTAYARIAYWLERLIVSRKLEAGDRLPSEVDIAGALGVSRMTLRQALSSVEEKGLIERRRGRFGGAFVSRPRFEYSLSGLPGFTEQMRRAHVEAGAHVIQATTKAAAAEVRAGLKLKRGDQIHEVIRVRSANGDPITLEETYFPAGIFAGMLGFELTDSLYRVMEREYGRGPYSADETIEPVTATPLQAELLGVAVGRPLLLVTRTAYDRGGTPVEYSRDHFRPDRTKIVLHTQVDP